MVDIDKAVIARLKTHGNNFEVMVDCDNALKLKEGKDIAMDDVLAAEKVFSDARKGLLASEAQMEQVFGTSEPDEVAKKIIKKGEIQITAEHKAKLVEQKKKKILEIIHTNGIDPKSGVPHPLSRLELAFEEAGVRIDEHKSADQQVDDVLKKLRPILPIKLEKRRIAVKIPAEYAGKAYSSISGFGKIERDDWLTDGSWSCVIEIPAGLQNDLLDSANRLTHGEAEVKILKTDEGE